MYGWGQSCLRKSHSNNCRVCITLVHDSRKRKKNKKKDMAFVMEKLPFRFCFYLGYRTLLKFSCIIPKSKGMSIHGRRHFLGLSPRHEHAKKLYDTGFREIAVIPLPLKSFILIMEHRRSKFHQHNWKKKYSLLHCNIQFQ